MTDELKQWEYDKGYAKGRIDVLEDIKAEIEKYARHEVIAISSAEEAGLQIAIDILDKHIKENKQ